MLWQASTDYLGSLPMIEATIWYLVRVHKRWEKRNCILATFLAVVVRSGIYSRDHQSFVRGPDIGKRPFHLYRTVNRPPLYVFADLVGLLKSTMSLSYFDHLLQALASWHTWSLCRDFSAACDRGQTPGLVERKLFEIIGPHERIISLSFSDTGLYLERAVNGNSAKLRTFQSTGTTRAGLLTSDPRSDGCIGR